MSPRPGISRGPIETVKGVPVFRIIKAKPDRMRQIHFVVSRAGEPEITLYLLVNVVQQLLDGRSTRATFANSRKQHGPTAGGETGIELHRHSYAKLAPAHLVQPLT